MSKNVTASSQGRDGRMATRVDRSCEVVEAEEAQLAILQL